MDYETKLVEALEIMVLADRGNNRPFDLPAEKARFSELCEKYGSCNQAILYARLTLVEAKQRIAETVVLHFQPEKT